MDAADWCIQTRFSLSAVLAHLQIPAGVLACLGSVDQLEIECEAGGPVVSFEVEDKIVALGRLTDRNGVLTATIIWTGCQLCSREASPWRLKNKLAQTENSKQISDGLIEDNHDSEDPSPERSDA